MYRDALTDKTGRTSSEWSSWPVREALITTQFHRSSQVDAGVGKSRRIRQTHIADAYPVARQCMYHAPVSRALGWCEYAHIPARRLPSEPEATLELISNCREGTSALPETRFRFGLFESQKRVQTIPES